MHAAAPLVRRRIALTWGGAMLVVACGLAGCGGSVADIPRPATLRGRVTWRRKPVVGAMVYAVSEAVPTAAPAVAQTGKDGTYAMAEVPGGRVRVAVVMSSQPEATGAAVGVACDPKYADWRTSGLVVDVAAGESTFDMTLD